ncbi:unnamed protein product [Periconia digitata]|uniref:Vacuolar protein sorting-associated protein 9a n=1 Tax=Periconia digitata TaxID=1303443 RepID=A0A9W4XI86_9PLEO|nr:unnamed protein product [Periconia digitata]
MSPPNQTPQLDDTQVQDGPDEQKLREVSTNVQEGVASTGLSSASPADDLPQLQAENLKNGDHNGSAGHVSTPYDNAGTGKLLKDKVEVGVDEVTKSASTKEKNVEELGAKEPVTAGDESNGEKQAEERTEQPLPDSDAQIQPKASASTAVESSDTPIVSPPDQAPAPPANAAGKAPIRSPSPPPPPPKDEKFLLTGEVPSRAASPSSPGKSNGRNSEDADAAEYAVKYAGNDGAVDDSQSEIQSIMEQFDLGHGGGPGAEEIMSPRLEIAQPLLESPALHPPRRSSLVPLDKPLPIPTEGTSENALQSPPPRSSSLHQPSRTEQPTIANEDVSSPKSPSSHASQFQKPAPLPDPEPDLPFDFHRFLEQLRHRTADPVAKFLRSFLLEFGKKQWMVHEQVKIIGDFLEFIGKKMAQCEVWRTVSDAEFDNAREGMEKLVMNRLYSQTFSPAIPPPEHLAPSKSRRRPEPLGPGRRGQHQEDVERDEVLAQKVRIYKWVREEHLDIKSVGDKGKKFLNLAQQELLKIKSYRAPRDKVICILNCCKVIFGYLRTSSSDMSADSFVPLLIYTVLQANPDHLVSNVQYILRFRNQDKLGGEAGYYISSLMGAIQFVEGIDKTSLTITDEEFEKNVEAAVSAIAERHQAENSPSATNAPSLPPRSNPPVTPGHRRVPSPHSLHPSEKSTISRPEITNRNSHEAERAGPRRSTSLRQGQPESDQQPEEENAAVAGLLRTIQRPLSTIGRIFSDSDTHASSSSSPGPAITPAPGSTPRHTPQPSRRSSEYPGGNAQEGHLNEKVNRREADEDRHRQRLSAEDAAARQASAEAEEARRIQRQEHSVVVETLAGMFPQLDRDVIDDVVRMKEGRVGLAVDACLALANP